MVIRSVQVVSSVLICAVFLIYDLWLIGTGLFHPGVLVIIMAWMAGLLVYCVRRQRQALPANH